MSMGAFIFRVCKYKKRISEMMCVAINKEQNYIYFYYGRFN